MKEVDLPRYEPPGQTKEPLTFPVSVYSLTLHEDLQTLASLDMLAFDD